jgi:hypothetical protein
MADLPPELVAKLERLDHVEQLAELTGRAQLEAQQQRQQEEELAAFDQHLSELRTKYGNYDEDWVLSHISARGVTPEEAVKAYQAWEQQALAAAQQRRLPHIMSAGGGMPSNQVDPSTLSPKDTKALVAEMIMMANSDQG